VVHQFRIVAFYVYILRSESTSRFYVGHTEDLGLRLAEHNGNGSRYTRNRGSWVLVHAEEHDTRAKARVLFRPEEYGRQTG
jgi:putative endonuclease